MNRRKFALSWGRKIFFGTSWPLSLVLTLVYLRSFIIPVTASDWIYYGSTLIGHTGLLNAILYFLLYCPLIILLPTYYVSRIWSLILILFLNLFILTDAISFSNYHLHLYSYLWKLIAEEGIHHIFGSDAGFMILGAGMLVLALLIWLRGEIVWRSMQARFSNPVRNWYLVIIGLCLIISKSLFFTAGIHPHLAENFTFNLNFTRAPAPYSDNRKFFFPRGDLQCVYKKNPNIVMIVLKQWNSDQFNTEMMPQTFHMKSHATSFLNHQSVSNSISGGMFTLKYSLPATYEASAVKTETPLLSELTKRKYEIVDFQSETSQSDPASRDADTMMKFQNWLASRSGEEINSHFLWFTLHQHSSSADKDIQEIVLQLQNENLLKNSYIIITGSSSASSGPMPLLWITPDRRSGEVSHLTTTYDVVPTLMTNAWGCKRAFPAAGVGEPLSQKERDWFISTIEDGFQINDVKKGGFITVQDGVVTNSETARKDLIFPALRLLTKFSRP